MTYRCRCPCLRRRGKSPVHQARWRIGGAAVVAAIAVRRAALVARAASHCRGQHCIRRRPTAARLFTTTQRSAHTSPAYLDTWLQTPLSAQLLPGDTASGEGVVDPDVAKVGTSGSHAGWQYCGGGGWGDSSITLLPPLLPARTPAVADCAPCSRRASGVSGKPWSRQLANAAVHESTTQASGTGVSL